MVEYLKTISLIVEKRIVVTSMYLSSGCTLHTLDVLVYVLVETGSPSDQSGHYGLANG